MFFPFDIFLISEISSLSNLAQQLSIKSLSLTAVIECGFEYIAFLNEKGKRLNPFPSFKRVIFASAAFQAVAGLLPVIGGRIGFKGLTAGSLSCGRSSSSEVGG